MLRGAREWRTKKKSQDPEGQEGYDTEVEEFKRVKGEEQVKKEEEDMQMHQTTIGFIVVGSRKHMNPTRISKVSSRGGREKVTIEGVT